MTLFSQLLRRSCAWRATPDANGPGAQAFRLRHGSAGTVTTPSLTLPRRGREPGASPQRGEVRRGGQRRMRVGEQPMFTLVLAGRRGLPRVCPGGEGSRREQGAQGDTGASQSTAAGRPRT